MKYAYLGRNFKRARPINNLGIGRVMTYLSLKLADGLLMRVGVKEKNKQKKMSDLLMLLVKIREIIQFYRFTITCLPT